MNCITQQKIEIKYCDIHSSEQTFELKSVYHTMNTNGEKLIANGDKQNANGEVPSRMLMVRCPAEC